jgi:hypothetical protein
MRRVAEECAVTKLEKSLKRELRVGKLAYVLTIEPEGFKLTRKGRRKGIEITWKDLVSGDAAMAVALNASVGKL